MNTEYRLSSPVRLGSPIYASDSEIMLVQFPIFFEPLSIGRIQLHLIEWLTVTFLDKTKNLFGVSRESKLFPIPRPCVAVDWTNSEAECEMDDRSWSTDNIILNATCGQ